MRIREYCAAVVRGQRLYPFINAVREAGIVCLAQHCRGGAFYCRLRKSALPDFRALAAQYGLQVRIREERSAMRSLRRFRLRIGIPLGLVMGLLLIAYCSNIVSVIEIQGADPGQEPVILSVLSAEGVVRGQWIGAVDAYRCEQRIRSQVEGLAWVGIRHTGSRLVVEVTQRRPEPEMLDEHMPANIVAAHDARITGMKVYAGRTVRLVGDGVTQGELLVSAASEDREGRVHFHHSMAQITGIYTQEADLSAPYRIRTSVPTGRRHTDMWLCFRHLRIPAGLLHRRYAQAAQAQRYLPLYFLGRELPVGILQCSETEMLTQETLRSQEETMLDLHGSIVRYEKNLLRDVAILDRTIEYDVTDEGLTCHICYTVEGEIGTTREIYVK